MFDFEEREPNELNLICLIAQAPNCLGLAIEPSPTFPFLESQCQRAQLGVNFHLAREAQPPARPWSYLRRGRRI